MMEFFEKEGWNVIHTLEREGRKAVRVTVDDLSLSKMTLDVVKCYDGIYSHQKEALRVFLEGGDVCLSTSTASGKSLAFHLCALERIASDGESKILAIYPAKALTEEQTRRWNKSFQMIGANASAGKIDGSVPVRQRMNILGKNNVVVMTPDVAHAWLLKSADAREINKFLRNLRVLIVDEAHVYTGAFGSHASFMFRRLGHCIAKCGGEAQIISASATISEPESHLRKLLGRDFTVVGGDLDSSGRHDLTVHFVNPPDFDKLLDHMATMLTYVAREINGQFIAFVDSRKRAEYIAALIERIGEKDTVRPYRAGYEESDRNEIQHSLTDGALKGVVSTNALELGLDIPGVSLGILVGIPPSGTNLRQRIGRVGRHCPGQIVIVNDGNPHSALVFSEPDKLFSLPLAESSLYLDNERIQYAHALCLASPGIGEDDKIRKKSLDEDIVLLCDFPANFEKLCENERRGLITDPVLNEIRGQAGDAPHYNLPIRSVEWQYDVEVAQGDIGMNSLGRLSQSQMLREAYPDAIYYYNARPYRVYAIDRMSRKIRVRREKKMFTTPKMLPEFISPNLRDENSRALSFGNFCLIETSANILQRVVGFAQQKGKRKEDYNYPLTGSPVRYPNEQFSRQFSTSGVFLWSPKLGRVSRDDCHAVAELLFEAFVYTVPYERQDINYGQGRFKMKQGFVSLNDKFVAIYDQNLGSLRLSSRMMSHDILRKCGDAAIKIAEASACSNAVMNFLRVLREEMEQEIYPTAIVESSPNSSEVNIITPNSIGISGHKRVIVRGVFYHPRDGIVYKGVLESDANVRMNVPHIHMEICEDSLMGTYNSDTGDIKEGD